MNDEKQAIDYRALLVKYMADVMDSESVSFIGHSRYTPAERAALLQIEYEAGTSLGMSLDPPTTSPLVE